MEQTKKLPKIGEILSVSVEATKKHFSVYVKVILPYLILMILQGAFSMFAEDSMVMLVLTGIATLAMIIYAFWMTVVLTRISYQAVMTGKVSEEKAKKEVGKVIWPLIAVSIIVGIVTGLGFILLIVPGIILALMYFAAQYLVIVDKKKIGESLSTSIKMAKGRKWDLFVKLFVSHIVVGVLYYIAIIIVSIIFAALGALVSEEVSGILALIGVSLAVIPFIPVFINLSTFIFGHLKKLNGMK